MDTSTYKSENISPVLGVVGSPRNMDRVTTIDVLVNPVNGTYVKGMLPVEDIQFLERLGNAMHAPPGERVEDHTIFHHDQYNTMMISYSGLREAMEAAEPGTA